MGIQIPNEAACSLELDCPVAAPWASEVQVAPGAFGLTAGLSVGDRIAAALILPHDEAQRTETLGEGLLGTVQLRGRGAAAD